MYSYLKYIDWKWIVLLQIKEKKISHWYALHFGVLVHLNAIKLATKISHCL